MKNNIVLIAAFLIVVAMICFTLAPDYRAYYGSIAEPPSEPYPPSEQEGNGTATVVNDFGQSIDRSSKKG